MHIRSNYRFMLNEALFCVSDAYQPSLGLRLSTFWRALSNAFTDVGA